VVAGGVTKTLAGVAKYMMPFLFLALMLLLIYGMVAGDFAASTHFLFAFNFAALSIDGVLVAMGHAFFTLSIGMGAIMAYGAYMPAKACIGRTILAVGLLDTLVALVAGLAIFSIVFANPDIQPSAGPGLLFVSLPVAFGHMPMGFLVGTLFFALVVVAAWSSAVSLIEPAVAWLMENSQWQRVGATALFTSIAWLLGFLTVLSFNDLSAFKPVWLLNFNPFEFLDFLTGQIMLPLGGVCIAVFVGWIMPWHLVEDELITVPNRLRKLWIIILRFISPAMVLIIMVLKLYESLKPFILDFLS
jgi:NSS family neurotransmitter:Na+ symporter